MQTDLKDIIEDLICPAVPVSEIQYVLSSLEDYVNEKCSEAREEGVDEGHSDGKDEGYEDGHIEGFAEGFAEGRQ